MSADDRSAPSKPVAVMEAPPRATASFYPSPFRERMAGREKRVLGDRYGLRNFGVNATRLSPGGQSSLKHRHTVQDEFIFVIEGRPVLVVDDREYQLEPGMCAGFPAGGPSHHLLNRSEEAVLYLEIGDRSPGDEVTYPDDDLQVRAGPSGQRRYERKSGIPY